MAWSSRAGVTRAPIARAACSGVIPLASALCGSAPRASSSSTTAGAVEQRRGQQGGPPIRPGAVQRRAMVQQQRHHRRIALVGGADDRQLPLGIGEAGIGAAVQQQPRRRLPPGIGGDHQQAVAPGILRVGRQALVQQGAQRRRLALPRQVEGVPPCSDPQPVGAAGEEAAQRAMEIGFLQQEGVVALVGSISTKLTLAAAAFSARTMPRLSRGGEQPVGGEGGDEEPRLVPRKAAARSPSCSAERSK